MPFPNPDAPPSATPWDAPPPAAREPSGATSARGRPVLELDGDAVPSRRAFWAALGGGLAATTAVLGGLVVALVVAPSLKARFTDVAALAMTVHGALMLGVLWLVLRWDGIGFARLGFRSPTPRLLHLLWQVPLTMTTVGVAQALVVAAVGDLPTNTDPKDYPGLLDSPGGIVLTVVAVCVLAPLWEETFFRGFLLARLRHLLRRRRWATAAAVGASALIFAGFHAFPPVIPYITVLGTCLALVRLWHHNLWASVLLHAANNTMATIGLLTALAGAR